jgi:hypothetical protein
MALPRDPVMEGEEAPESGETDTLLPEKGNSVKCLEVL